MTINPNDKASPFVMKLAGVDLDVSSRLKEDLPSCVERLQTIAEDPVAAADFFHITIDAVMTALLRCKATDSDGGVLGRTKAFVAEFLYRLSPFFGTLFVAHTGHTNMHFLCYTETLLNTTTSPRMHVIFSQV